MSESVQDAAVGHAIRKIAYSRRVPAILLLARIAAGVTQKDAAKHLGKLSSMDIWMIEKGHRYATNEEAEILCRLYKIPKAWVQHEVDRY